MRDANDVAERLDIFDSRLDGLDVARPGRVQNLLVLVDGGIGPVVVHGASIFEDSVENAQQAERDDRFLVDHVELIADGIDGGACTCRENGGLAREGGAWQGVDDGLGLLLGLLDRDVGCVALRCQGGGEGR